MIFDDDDVLVAADFGRQPGGVEAVQPRHRHDARGGLATSGQQFRSDEGLMEHHRAIRDEHDVGAIAQHCAAPDARQAPEVEPARRRADHQADRDGLLRLEHRPPYERGRLVP